MNSQEDQELKRRLQEIEAKINQPPSSQPFSSHSSQPLASQRGDRWQSLQSTGEQVTQWFNGLSGVGKAVAISTAAIVGFMVLKTVFQLVAALISLALVGGLLYLGYRLFIATKTSK